MHHFWLIDEVPNVPKLSPEEAACEEHFLSTYERDETERFVVEPPFKEILPQLDDCRSLALKLFLMQESDSLVTLNCRRNM